MSVIKRREKRQVKLFGKRHQPFESKRKIKPRVAGTRKRTAMRRMMR
jgi:hypothetical protein